jgi:hypothetical protein
VGPRGRLFLLSGPEGQTTMLGGEEQQLQAATSLITQFYRPIFYKLYAKAIEAPS